MTAEIVIMNKSAIAIAADSAATLPVNSNGEKKVKIYTSNKLFMLSKFSPVGLMIYGASEILGFPWEGIIKQFRKELGTKSYSTTKEYGECLIKFLNGYFPEENQDIFADFYISSFFREVILVDINESVEKITKEEKINNRKISQVIRKIIDESLKQFESSENIIPTTQEDFERIINKHKQKIDVAINDIFVKLPISKYNKAKLYKIGAYLLTKDLYVFENTGIVIAGFGDSEKFPSVFAFSIDGVFENRIKVKENTDQKISIRNSAAILPFAQHEMVNTFIEGVDPSFDQLLNGYLSQYFLDFPKALVDIIVNDEKQKKELLKKLNTFSKEKLKTFQNNLDQFKTRNFIRPIIDSVHFLPPDELAAMAESLVNLTSFKRRVSLDSYETVGGPIDVAIITKGDGFIWIKRKHYFNKDLNHHFFNNYYRDCDDKIKESSNEEQNEE